MDDPISNSPKEHGKNCMEWRITDELLRGKMFAQKTDIENYFSKCSFGKFVCSVNKTFDLLFFVYFVVTLFYLSGWLSAWSYSQGPQPSPVIPDILG